MTVTRKHFTFRYRSAQDWFATFCDYYGPTVKAWAALDDVGRPPFQEQLVVLADRVNCAGNGSLAVDSEYVEVVATRRWPAGKRLARAEAQPLDGVLQDVDQVGPPVG